MTMHRRLDDDGVDAIGSRRLEEDYHDAAPRRSVAGDAAPSSDRSEITRVRRRNDDSGGGGGGRRGPRSRAVPPNASPASRMLTAAVLAGSLSARVSAMIPNPAPYTYVQPDGTPIWLKQQGNPGRRLVIDRRGYTCIPVENFPGDLPARLRDGGGGGGYGEEGGEDAGDDADGENIWGDPETNILGGGSDAAEDAEVGGDGNLNLSSSAGPVPAGPVKNRWYMYATRDEESGALISSGLRCGIDDPSSIGLEKRLSPIVAYGDRRQLRSGGGSTPGFECGEYCHPDHHTSRIGRRRTDWVEDMRGGGPNGLSHQEHREWRRLREENGEGHFGERDPYNPELPLELEEAVPLEVLEERGVDVNDSDAVHAALDNGGFPVDDPVVVIDGVGGMEPGQVPQASMLANYQQRQGERRLAPTKKLKNLVLCFKFADHRNRAVPSKNDIAALMSHGGASHAKAPTGSVSKLFKDNSYNAFDLESTVVDWVVLDNTEAYYTDGVSGLGMRMHEAIVDCLRKVKALGKINFKEFDVYENGGAGDGVVDCISFFHSGYPAEFSPDPDCMGQGAHNRVWSHEWMLSNPWFDSDTGVMVQFYPLNSAFWGVCGNEIARVGVIFHEIAHFLGCPDLYDTRPDENGYFGFGAGTFGAMGNAWGEDYSQYYPRIMCPWTRFTLGWLTPKVITSSGTYSLQGSRKFKECYIIKHNMPNGEYFVCENMMETGHSAKGLLCWHIDNGVFDLEDQSNTAPVYNELDGYPGLNNAFGPWPQNGYHYRVAAIQGDGGFELENGFNEGDGFDPISKCWNDELGPSKDPRTGPFPNTDSYQGGNVKQTGIRIYDAGEPGQRITFKVELGVTYEQSQRSAIKNIKPKFANAMMWEHYLIQGCMFHVYPKEAVTIRGFHVHVDFTSTKAAEIWKLPTNQWFNEENRAYDRSKWAKVGTFQVKGRGLHCTTPIDLDEPIEMDGNTITAFYITFFEEVMVHGAPDPSYQGQDLGKAVNGENAHVRTTYGTGNNFPWQGIVAATKVNAGVKYSLGKGPLPATPAPVVSPTPAPFVSEPQTSLVTRFEGGNSAAGCMFNAQTKRDIEFRSVSVNAAPGFSGEVIVYFNPDGYVNKETDPTNWVQFCRASITSAGQNAQTRIPEDNCGNIWVTAGETRGFFVQFPADGNMIVSNGDEGQVSSQNGDVAIYNGVSKGAGGFNGNNHRGKDCNVVLHYDHEKTEQVIQERTGTDKELSTGSQWNNQASGNMFNIKPRRDLEVKSWSVHADQTHQVRVLVYLVQGDFSGIKDNLGAWGSPVCDATISGGGRGSLVKIPPENCALQELSAGTTYAVYIDFEQVGNRHMKMMYATGFSTGTSVASNDDLEVFAGCGKGSDFGNTYMDRKWLGTCHYTVY